METRGHFLVSNLAFIRHLDVASSRRVTLADIDCFIANAVPSNFLIILMISILVGDNNGTRGPQDNSLIFPFFIYLFV